MGVRKLTGFVRRHSLLVAERLADCPLVIDGSNLYWVILERLPYGNGGVYELYTRQVETFFYDLKRCKISPIVLIDGTFNTDCEKLPTLLQDMRTKIIKKESRKVKVEKAEIKCSKVLFRNIFIEVLQRLKVPYAMCFFEADVPAAALARRLGRSVFGLMSDDSDSFTLGVTSVQIPSRRPALELREPSPGYFMMCEVFRPQRFLEYFHVSEEMMPLVATLPGNDAFSPSLFNAFFDRLEEQYCLWEENTKRLEILMRWLADQTSLQLALKEVLESIREKERDRFAKFILTFNSTMDEENLDFLKDTATMVFPAGVALAKSSGTSPSGSQTPPVFLKPPALRRAVARGAVLRLSISAVYGLPWRLKPRLDDPLLLCSSRAAVPLLTRLSALLGAPVGPQVIFTQHECELRQLLASCTWRAPLLDRVLLGGAASCRRTALAALQLRPGALAELPPLLQLPAATLVTWRRATASRSGRHQVRAVLLCLLALTPNDTRARDLGLTPAAAADWRARAAPLRLAGMKKAWFDVTALHLYNELQAVYEVVLSLNAVLGRPLAQLTVEHTLHIPLTMRLGFISSGEGVKVETGAKFKVGTEVEALVSAVTDVIEAEVLRCLDAEEDSEGSDPEPWRPSSRQDTSNEHTDLRAAAILTGVLNKMAASNAARMRETLSGLSVKTEYGLYTLVDAVCRRAVAEPSEVATCANACSILADRQVTSDRVGARRVCFVDLLLTRLFLGVAPASRPIPGCSSKSAPPVSLSRDHLLQHLDTEPDPAARWRQFGLLTEAWRASERRQCAFLLLLAAVIRRRLVPVWAARRCLARLLGGDGETRPPPEGQMRADDASLLMTWSDPTPEVEQALQELVDWCNSESEGGDGAEPGKPPQPLQ